MILKNFSVLLLSFLIWVPVNEEVISWREDTRLAWNMFRARPQKIGSAVALTASGITFEFRTQESNSGIVHFDTKVFAHFYPDKSWYIVKETNPYILSHEQLHFDITELYARKFRHQISQLKVSNDIKIELRTLHEEINKEMAQVQRLYDTETDHSVNRESQAKWEIYIKKELSKLNAFKSKD